MAEQSKKGLPRGYVAAEAKERNGLAAGERDELAVAASKKMSTEEVRKVRKEINDLVDRAVERKPRRETAY